MSLRRRGCSRIIPAYAGSTRSRGLARERFPDHPRIRGEHTYANMEQESILGSSPHTRGAPHDGARVLITLRIIPAYAGSTFSPIWTREKSRDHPRIRGEHVASEEEI